MVNYDRVAERIFGVIKGLGHTVLLYNNEGAEVSNPAEARRFFVSDPNYMVTLDEDMREIKINRNKNTELEDFESLLKRMRELGRTFMLKTNVKVFGRSIKPKDYAYQAKQHKDKEIEDVLEANMYGSKKTSYQKMESVRLVVKHEKEVNEEVRGARSRAIKSIFIEHDGERTEFPFKSLQAARAMGRHYSNGGVMEDKVGQHILRITENMYKLKDFVQYSRKSDLINEENEELVSMARTQFNNLKEQLKKLSGVRTYEAIREEIEQLEEQECETRDDLKDMFTVSKIDDKVESALPIISNLLNEKEAHLKRIEEASTQPFVLNKEVSLDEEEIIEYDSPIQNTGHKLKNIVRRVSEESELSKYLLDLAESMLEGNEVDDFGKGIIRNTLENIQIKNI